MLIPVLKQVLLEVTITEQVDEKVGSIIVPKEVKQKTGPMFTYKLIACGNDAPKYLHSYIGNQVEVGATHVRFIEIDVGGTSKQLTLVPYEAITGVYE